MASINRGSLTSIIDVEQTKRFTNEDIRVQVIKTKQSQNSSNLEVHLSDQEHIFVGISKADQSKLPLFSIINLSDFSIIFPKRFINIMNFSVIGQEGEIRIPSHGKNLSYHSVYKKDSQQPQAPQQQVPPRQPQQQQQQQQPQYRANTTVNYNNNNNNNNNNNVGNIPYLSKPSASQRNPTSRANNNNFSADFGNIDPNTQITDILSINTHLNGTNSTIRAMVKNKAPLRSWSKDHNKEGKLFSVELYDVTSGIKAAAFADSSASFIEPLYNSLENNCVYLIQNFYVKPKNERYNSLDHCCEITLNANTRVLMHEDQTPIDPIYKFVKIQDISMAEDNSIIDVIGMITNKSTKASIKSKAGNDLTKLSITILDDSGASIDVVFWNEKANEFENLNILGQIIAIKSAKVSNFSGKTLSFSFTSTYEINAERLPETSMIRAFTKSDISTPSNSLSVSTFVAHKCTDLPIFMIKTMPSDGPIQIITDSKTDKSYYRTIGQLQRIIPLTSDAIIKQNEENEAAGRQEQKFPEWKYRSCPKCKKSVVEGNCTDHIDEEPVFSYRITFRLTDGFDSINVDAMGVVGNNLIGYSPDELNMKDQDEVNRIFTKLLAKTYVVTLSASTYHDKNKNITIPRYNLHSANPIDPRSTDNEGARIDTDLFRKSVEDSFYECKLFISPSV